MSDPKAESRSIFERHTQSVLLAVTTAAVLYSGSFVVQAKEDAARTSAQLAVLTTEVAGLRAQLAVMQTSFATRDDYRDHETRLRALESSARLSAATGRRP